MVTLIRDAWPACAIAHIRTESLPATIFVAGKRNFAGRDKGVSLVSPEPFRRAPLSTEQCAAPRIRACRCGLHDGRTGQRRGLRSGCQCDGSQCQPLSRQGARTQSNRVSRMVRVVRCAEQITRRVFPRGMPGCAGPGPERHLIGGQHHTPDRHYHPSVACRRRWLVPPRTLVLIYLSLLGSLHFLRTEARQMELGRLIFRKYMWPA
jgi:hypothetical protein